jgi:hypothetical protein
MIDKKYYLYIKTSPFGLKYLGKTTKNPFTYNGSGKIWKRHIKKHNLTHINIKTEIVFETDNKEELIKMGNELSVKYNVVKSSDWANLRIENGDGGDTSKFIDYSKPVFHDKHRADHWHGIEKTPEERKIFYLEKNKKIDYKNPDRLKKIKDNTDWKSWYESIKKRKLDYVNMRRNVVNKRSIQQIDLNDNIIAEYNSITEASKKLNCNRSGISQCLNKRNETSFGYKWKYKN